ncbi:hypothetical protein [Tomitella fengzijianii]|uniref:YbaB/EbfC DNA-binding family protein n=1 Tax=Tomitella fengzijianii TaxID=2597660 RepID=A0A516X5K8_9ACTN|nr:hypothetical protein [Tomitella fengzijianii]QDQ98345.1 hypothetical protein FO059_14765 [Tomitella fengzijianii]
MADQGMTVESGDGMAAAVESAWTQVERLRGCAEQMRAAVGTGSSADGSVEAEVDGLGMPAALRLHEEVRALRGPELGARVVEAFAAASHDLARRHRAVQVELGLA